MTVTGGWSNLSQTPAPNYVSNTNVGTQRLATRYAGDAEPHRFGTDSENFAIAQAPTTTTVICAAGPHVVYTGSAIEPCSVTVTGAEFSTRQPAPVLLRIT